MFDKRTLFNYDFYYLIFNSLRIKNLSNVNFFSNYKETRFYWTHLYICESI